MGDLLIAAGISILAANGIFQAVRIRKLEKSVEELQGKGKNPRRSRGIVR